MSADSPRREFLGRLATSTLALAGAAALPAELLAAAPGAPDAAAPAFDDSWTARVKRAKHKAVFDGPEVSDGLPIFQAWIFRSGYRQALGAKDEDVVPVVVLRHAATLLTLDDALWAKYQLGASRKIDDPKTKKPAERNPWSRRVAGDAPDADTNALLGLDMDATVEGLVKSGAVVLTCNLALTRFAQGLARKAGVEPAAMLAELKAGLVPGVIVQPSGVYATARAQEVGCIFMRST